MNLAPLKITVPDFPDYPSDTIQTTFADRFAPVQFYLFLAIFSEDNKLHPIRLPSLPFRSDARPLNQAITSDSSQPQLLPPKRKRMGNFPTFSKRQMVGSLSPIMARSSGFLITRSIDFPTESPVSLRLHFHDNTI
jgi:hypothetical protein